MAINKIIYGGDVLLDLTADTVSADKLLKGITAHDKLVQYLDLAIKPVAYNVTFEDSVKIRVDAPKGWTGARPTPGERSSPERCRIMAA